MSHPDIRHATIPEQHARPMPSRPVIDVSAIGSMFADIASLFASASPRFSPPWLLCEASPRRRQDMYQRRSLISPSSNRNALLMREQ